MKKIPSNVQSLLSASNQINNYNKAVEELVFNSLDAGATSIAVRINIHENTIQVLDNGSGVHSKDFSSIGQKYMTSKFVDLSTLKSAPNKYGYRGQFLANLVNVSKTVKVISRHEKSEGTWMKLFENGKEKLIEKWNTRPSKGTTVEVKGFLFNLNIHQKSRDILSELQSIKTFLEYMSIVHGNISLSLRDDSKDEILFKMHKNRNIYQTLSTLYNIERKDFQELQVEKNEYRVTGFLRKSGNVVGKHLVFLNGKFIASSSTLHKIINNNLKKRSNSRGRKDKAKDLNKDEENYLFQKEIPDYFIFIKCPYMDYNMSTSPKQLVLEFKDWNQVTKLLEKLIRFFSGDINLKEVDNVDKNKVIHKENYNVETREQVKKIMEKILGGQSKKPGISHLQNGIKGKRVKRKRKNKKLTKITTADMINLKDNSKNDRTKSADIFDDHCITQKIIPSTKIKRTVGKATNINKKPVTKKYPNSDYLELYLGKNVLAKTYNSKFKKISIANKKQPQKKQCAKKDDETKKDNLFKNVEMSIDSVKKRYNKLHKISRNKLKQRNKDKSKEFVIDIEQLNNIITDINNVAMPKQMAEMVVNDCDSNASKHNLINSDCKNDHNNMKSLLLPTNYDLLQTMLKSKVNEPKKAVPVMDKQLKTAILKPHSPIIDTDLENSMTDLKVTFQSHNYNVGQNVNNGKISYTHHNTDLQRKHNDDRNFNKRSKAFITKESKENFTIPKSSYKNNITHKFKTKNRKDGLTKQFKSHIKKLFKQTSKLFNLKKQIMGNSEESSLYTIEFTESNRYNDHKLIRNSSDLRIKHRKGSEDLWSQSINFNFNVGNSNRFSLNTNTYTVSNFDDNGYTILNEHNWNTYGTYTIECTNEAFNQQVAYEVDENCINNDRSVYISETQEHSQYGQINDPADVCETVLNSQEILDREFRISFNDSRKNTLSNGAINNNYSQIKHNNSLYDNLCTLDEEHDQETTENQHPCQAENIHPDKIFHEVSHHFNLPKTSEIDNTNRVTNSEDQCPIIPNSRFNTTEEKQSILPNAVAKKLTNLNLDNFNIKNRMCFVPKGMSPIFENCHTKNICDYDLAKDYYEDEVYDNFVDNVRNNAEVFKPNIQESKELTTKDINKVNAKLNKNNSSLKFDAESLKDARVLGQIDEKFIATVMKEGSNKEEISNFLVLFDQHAVHERIRLEKNLSDYFTENQWKPINIDDVCLKISKDEILYLHNFKDKFEQLGLRWTFLENFEVSFSAIAEAILGKNPRPVDVVLKAVKNLITEEINIIKMQGGCISLYPKSIMDLVFSEACRYAIKFGDKLSKSECEDLLKLLSNCNTPFQCAHGRPVMAVIMDIKLNKVDYMVNFKRIMEWNR